MISGYAVDICHPCTASVRKWHDAGLIDPIDTTRLEHWDDIFPSLKTLKGTTANGQNLLVPFDWGNSSVLYRIDLVDPAFLENESWEILFDDRYADRVAMYDSVDAVMGVAGLVVGAENPFAMTEEELERAMDMLRKQRGLLRFYWTDRTQVQQALASGELIAAYAWNSEYVALKAEGHPVAYATPKEGIYSWVCGPGSRKDGLGRRGPGLRLFQRPHRARSRRVPRDRIRHRPLEHGDLQTGTRGADRQPRHSGPGQPSRE